MRTEDIFPEALLADRAHLVQGDMSRTPCVFYFRKSLGDDFATQVLRCLQYARSAGLRLDTTVGVEGVYYDDDKSGMKDIERPGYNRLLADILSGKLTGRWVIVREQDRLSRRESSKLEEYHALTEMAKVRTFDSGGREIRDDVATGVHAVYSRAEAKFASVRQRARKELRAIQGTTPASRQRRIGYTLGYGAIVWEEAKMLRRARNKVVAGQSLASHCAHLRAEGIVKPNGKLYRTTDLTRLLRSPVYAGLRPFSRDIEIEGQIIPAGKPVAKGIWPRIFTEEEHYEVVAALSKNKSWATERSPKHLLTGILVCGECGTRMSYGWKNGKPRKDGTKTRYYLYRCVASRGGCGRVSRNDAVLEQFITKLTYEAIKRLPVAVEKVVDTTAAEIGRQEGKIRDAVEAFKNDLIGIAELADIRQDAQKKIDALKKERKPKAQPLPIDDAESFLSCEDVNKKRDTIRRFFPVIGVKSGGQGSRFHPDQLVFPEGTDAVRSAS